MFGNSKPSGARLLADARYVDDLGEAVYMSIYIIDPNNNNNVLGDVSKFNTFPESSISETTANP